MFDEHNLHVDYDSHNLDVDEHNLDVDEHNHDDVYVPTEWQLPLHRRHSMLQRNLQQDWLLQFMPT